LRSGFTNPDDFWRLPEDTQALLVVYWETKDAMTYVVERESSRKMDSRSGKGGDRNK